MSRYRGLFVHGALSESEFVARLRLFVLWKISRLLKNYKKKTVWRLIPSKLVKIRPSDFANVNRPPGFHPK